MTLTLLEGQRYDMPASFGPSSIPRRTEVRDAEALVLSARTEGATARALVPAHFEIPDRPVLTLAHMQYRDVDYLGGRSYNEIVVSLSASVGAGDARIDAAIAVVLWVDQPGALIAGREYMGLPKLFGRISPLQTRDDGAICFDCREYDAGLIEASVTNLSALDDTRLARLNERADAVSTFGWKYIPGPDGADLDYPLLNVMRWSYREAWTGHGSFSFLPVSRREAPLSAAAVGRLAALPIVGDTRAFRGRGTATIDRTGTRRIGS